MPSIGHVGAIDHQSATKFRKAGMRTTEALMKKAATKSSRRRLAKATGIAERQILAWANRADLMRCKGVGSEYSDLLEAAGVDTIKELRRRSAVSLTRRLVEINEKSRLVRRLPTEGMVAGWIEEANAIDPLVKY